MVVCVGRTPSIEVLVDTSVEIFVLQVNFSLRLASTWVKVVSVLLTNSLLMTVHAFCTVHYRAVWPFVKLLDFSASFWVVRVCPLLSHFVVTCSNCLCFSLQRIISWRIRIPEFLAHKKRSVSFRSGSRYLWDSVYLLFDRFFLSWIWPISNPGCHCNISPFDNPASDVVFKFYISATTSPSPFSSKEDPSST